jgi:GT2 family glycosyltransferase
MDHVVSVVIVNRDTRDDLVACLASLGDRQGVEVIVVDNASTDGSADAVRAHAPWARLIGNRTNRGLAAGNNQGIAASSGRVIVIANADVVFEPETITELAQTFERHPLAGMVFARLLNSDGSVQTAAGTLPTFAEAFRGRNHQAKVRRVPPDASFWWDGWAHDEEIAIGHGGEACYAVTRDLVERVGVQDERFVLDWEGIDWCARAFDAGFEIWFCPRAQVIHTGSRSIARARWHWVVSTHRGMYRYFAKGTPRSVHPFMAAAIAARAVAKGAAVLLGRGFYSRHVNR